MHMAAEHRGDSRSWRSLQSAVIGHGALAPSRTTARAVGVLPACLPGISQYDVCRNGY